MSKKFLRVLSVFLTLIMVISAFPFVNLFASAETVTETKYLFEKATTLEVGKQYAIVVKYNNRYYAVQMVDSEVEDIDPDYCPEPAEAYLSLNTRTASTRDVTNMIIEDGATSYLVGVDDTVLWDTPKRAQGRSGSYVNVDNVQTQVNSGIVAQSRSDTSRGIYMGQVIKENNTFTTAGGTYGLWTLPPEYDGDPYKNERGLNYVYNSSRGTGELYAVGASGTYFLEFKPDPVTGGMKFDNHKEESTSSWTTNFPSTSDYSAEIILFSANSSSSTIQTTKTVNEATYIANKYIEYKWNYDGANGAYQIVYKNSAIGFTSEVVPIFIPATELQAGHAYVIAAGTSTLKENLSPFTLSSSDATAVNNDNEADVLDIALSDTFLVDGGAYWTSESYSSVTGEYYLYYQASEGADKYYLSAADCALFTGSDKATWCTPSPDHKLQSYSDNTSLYFDGTGWVMLESLSNVTLYDVVFAQMSMRPATCIEGESKWYDFSFDGKNYTCKYIVDEALDPTNHYSRVVDSTAHGEPTCMRSGYEGAIKCTACGEALGYEREIPIDPNAHKLGYVYNGNRTHSYKCINTDLIGTVCSHVVSTTACTDANHDCVCDICLHELEHIANIENATCTEDKVCTNCGIILEAATGHEISTNVVSLGGGTHAYSCSKCSLSIAAESCFDTNSDCLCDACSYQFEHTPGVAATCITPQRCNNCGIILVEALGHSYTGNIRCYNNGTHAYKCVNGCGSYGTQAGGVSTTEACSDSPTDNDCKCDICAYQLAHTPGAAATCITDQVCTLCGTVITQAFGHRFNGTARDNNDGTHSYLCANGCGNYGTNAGGIGGTEACSKSSIDCRCQVCAHQYAHTPNVDNATCVTAKVCTVCSTVLEARLEHSYTDTSNVRSNNNGTHSYKCVNGCSNYGNATACADTAQDDCKCDVCTYQLPHTPGTSATCTDAQLCTICSAVVSPALGHDYSGTAISDNAGHHSGSCSRCGLLGASEDCYDSDRDCKCDVCAYQLAHTTNAEDATCLSAKYCTNCGLIIAQKLEHSYTGTVRSYSNGTHAYMCVNGCGLYGAREACADSDSNCICDICSYQLPHTPGAEATCTTAQECTVCHTVIQPALGHSFIGAVIDNNDGTHSYTCVNGCGEHSEAEACLKSSLDCRCSVCDHQFEHTPGAAANCLSAQYCTYCSIKLSDRLSHSYTGAARSNGNGTHSYQCVNGCGNYSAITECADTLKDDCKCDACGYQFEHTAIIDAAVTEDCLNSGLTEGSHCEVCGTVIVAQEVIPAIAHRNAYLVEGVDSTCYEDGIEDGMYCPDCETWVEGHNVLARKEHTYLIDAYIAPTCTQDGISEGKHCSLCNEVVVAQEVLPATGHSFHADVILPTCTEKGFTIYTCTTCGYSYFGNYTDASHIDENEDGYCDRCGAELSEHHPADTVNCDCICHSSNGFSRFIYRITLFFWRTFGMNKTCECGIQHY